MADRQDVPIEIQIGLRLSEVRKKLVVAESCTGGSIGNLITDIPGSSEYFLGGVISYSNEMKEKILGVKKETLVNFGAVSSQTALEMAAGVRSLMADEFGLQNIIGLSATGIAGPGGDVSGKPVGLVWIGISSSRGDHARQYRWNGDRIENKNLSTQAALHLLLETING